VSALTEGPLLWYLNRGSGAVLLVLFTLSTVLGVLSAREGRRRLVPGIVTQGLHRNLTLLCLGLLAGHVTTAVVDTYVDIRWWQAFSPVGATYRPLWLAAGALALDAVVVLVATSLLRDRIPHHVWRALHWTGYVAWGLAMAHAAGIGTDASTDWGRRVGLGCVAVVLLAVVVRYVADLHAQETARATSAEVR
jgi:DMSO/TMAO reductase YedYZ heme-binding membrane subunit